MIDFWKKKTHQSSKAEIRFVSFQKRTGVESKLLLCRLLSEGGKSAGMISRCRCACYLARRTYQKRFVCCFPEFCSDLLSANQP